MMSPASRHGALVDGVPRLRDIAIGTLILAVHMASSADQKRRPATGVGAGPEAPEADAFAGLASLLRVQPELQQVCRFGAQWASEHGPEESGWAPFHIVTAGACLLDVGDQVDVRLEAGDVAVLPHGSPHTTRSLPDAAGQARPVQVSRRAHDSILLKGNGVATSSAELVCGRLRFEQARNNMVLAALPAVVILPAQGRDAARAKTMVDLVRSELDDDRPGAALLATTLASALMTLVLRAHLEGRQASQGLFALLSGRQTARVVAALLDDVARDWTLDELAERAITSRATLVRLFRKAVDVPPLAFLTDLRLNLARHRLRATSAPLALIAEEVGYSSETAFSRAYHRRFGRPPGSERLMPEAGPDPRRRTPDAADPV